jgi:hypothetical protein
MEKESTLIKIARMEEQNKNIECKVDLLIAKFDKLESKFAPIWVENAMIGFISIICLSVIGALLTLIIK